MNPKSYLAGILVGLVAWSTWELVSRDHVMAAGMVSLCVMHINIALMKGTQ